MLDAACAPANTPFSTARTRSLSAWLGGPCEVCRRWSTQRLCTSCTGRFAAVQRRCTGCGLPLAHGAERCGACIQQPPPYQHCICGVDYRFPWDRLVLRYKFNQAPELRLMLVDQLLAAARSIGAPVPQRFVPVPLSDERLSERGYDQAWELARELGRELGVPADPRAVTRRFDARRQASLSRRERLANLRGAFSVPPAQRHLVEDRHIGLVDDVMTTGATVDEVTRTLLNAGAARVDLWVLARTPSPAAADEAP